MTITTPSNLTAGATTAPNEYAFKFIRGDDGVGTIEFLKNGAVVKSQANAGWDDALPWATGSDYKLYLGKDKIEFPKGVLNHAWDMKDDPVGRQGIQLHLGNEKMPSQAVTGCMGANADFLNYCYKSMYVDDTIARTAGIPLSVSASNGSDYNVTVQSTVSTSNLTAGDTAKLTISLGGLGGANGVSKDLYFRLNVDKTGAVSSNAVYGKDFEILAKDVDGAILDDKGMKAINTGNWKEGIYVRLPAHMSTYTYDIHVKSDFTSTTPKTIDLKIDDYFVVRKGTEKYSDFSTQPGTLLDNSSVDNKIIVEEKPGLKSAHLSGGIEGVQKVYNVHVGDVINYGFQAYSIPDSLSISDGFSQVGTGGFVSNFHSGSITAQSNQISVIVVGSSAGTAWDLDLTDIGNPNPSQTPTSPLPTLISDIHYAASPTLASLVASDEPQVSIASHVQNAPTLSSAGASLASIASFDLTVTNSQVSSSPTINVTAGHVYFAVVKGLEATGSTLDLPQSYIQIFGSQDASPAVTAHNSSLLNETAAFFQSSTDDTVHFGVGSDGQNVSGHVSLQIYDASALTGSLIELGSSVSAVEGEEAGRSTMAVNRFGDLSQSETFTFDIVPDSDHPLSASDFADPSLTRSVTFAAGQAVATIDLTPASDSLIEGVEGATVRLNTNGLSAETIGNLGLLGVATEAHVSVRDPDTFDLVPYPTINGSNASGNESDGVIHFQIALSQAATSDVSVAYATLDGTAIAGQNYSSSSGTLTFAAGETTKFVDISLLQHAGSDDGKSFQLKLLNPFGGELPNGAVVSTLSGVISDNSATGVQPDHASGQGLANPLTGNVLTNDTGALPLHLSAIQFGSGLSYDLSGGTPAVVKAPTGILTIGSDGNYSFTPTTAGHASFLETVTDASGASTHVTLDFDITRVAPPTSQSFNFALDAAHFDFSHGHDIMTAPDGTRVDLTGFKDISFTDGTVHSHTNSPLVDNLFYYANNKDVWDAHLDAAQHYKDFGWHEHRDPNAYFSTDGYLAYNSDVAAAGMNPLAHYAQYGWHEGRSPSENFSAEAYQAMNPDVAAAGINPLEHYLNFGQSEGRAALPGLTIAQGSGDHLYGDFDATYYLAHNTDVAGAVPRGVTPDSFAFQHYLSFGANEGRDPNAFFSSSQYLTSNPDVLVTGQNPVTHYEQYGWQEGRSTSGFDANHYLAANPDVAAAGIDPLHHFLQFGLAEGRSPL